MTVYYKSTEGMTTDLPASYVYNSRYEVVPSFEEVPRLLTARFYSKPIN